MPRIKHIINQRKNNYTTKDSHAPVHFGRTGMVGERKETKCPYNNQDHDGNCVADRRKFAHTPACWGQRLVAPASKTNATNGDNVGRKKGGGAEGHDGIEGHRGSNVDQ